MLSRGNTVLRGDLSFSKIIGYCEERRNLVFNSCESHLLVKMKNLGTATCIAEQSLI